MDSEEVSGSDSKNRAPVSMFSDGLNNIITTSSNPTQQPDAMQTLLQKLQGKLVAWTPDADMVPLYKDAAKFYHEHGVIGKPTVAEFSRMCSDAVTLVFLRRKQKALERGEQQPTLSREDLVRELQNLSL
jgi:hypothetical protein